MYDAFPPAIEVLPSLTSLASPLVVNPLPVMMDVAPFLMYCVPTDETVGLVLSIVKLPPVPTFSASSVTVT